MACTVRGVCGVNAIEVVGEVHGYVLALVQTHLPSLVDPTVPSWDLFRRVKYVAWLHALVREPNFAYAIQYTLFQNGRWFMRIQIGPCCLVRDKIFFWILSLRTRHQGLIWIKTKEYLKGGHFGIRCIHTELTAPHTGFSGPIKHNQRNDGTEQQQLIRIPTGRRQTSWLFTSEAGKFNQGLSGTNSANWWEPVLKPGTADLKASALTTGPHCLLSKQRGARLNFVCKPSLLILLDPWLR